MRYFITELIHSNRQFLLYCVLGLSGVAVDFGSYGIMTNLLGVHPQAANAISVTAGIATSFSLNAAFTFRTRDRLLFRFVCFYCVGLVGMALSALTLYVFAHRLGFNHNWVKLATVYVVVVQYNLNRRVSFAK